MIRYGGGKLVPANVRSAIKFIAKTGGISTGIWQRHFATGSLRNQEKQLQRLVQRNVFKVHSGVMRGRYVFGKKGAEFAQGLDMYPVSPISAQHFLHDEVLGAAAISLDKDGLLEGWDTEKELKQEQSESFRISGKGAEAKYPDLLCEIICAGDRLNLAIEYERTGKSLIRYRSIVWQYSQLESVDLVIFIVEDSSIKKRIKEAMRLVGDHSVNCKIGFVSALDWIKDPCRAKIQFSNRDVSIRQMVLS